MHDINCPHPMSVHSDAAKRISDQYNLHLIGAGHDGIGKWMSAALHDGYSDGNLYDYRLQAVTHQKHNENFYLYLPIQPGGMSACEAESVLKNHRLLAGMQLADRDHHAGGRQVIPRLSIEDQESMMNPYTRPTNLVFGPE